MPVYEYLCEPCDTRFERYLPRFDEPVECPTCHGTRVEKQLSSFALAGSSGPAQRGGGACCGGGCGCGH